MQLSDGYTDLPAGKLANVVTCLEMHERPPARDAPDVGCTLERFTAADAASYRSLFRRIGQEYLWASRLLLTEEQLTALLRDERIEAYRVMRGGAECGMLELDFRSANECELVFFGLTQECIGRGIGRWLMERALDIAWSHPIRRLWVHTCTFDHPSAVAFYLRSGFTAFKRQIELSDDPRLTGLLPRDCAGWIPVV